MEDSSEMAARAKAPEGDGDKLLKMMADKKVSQSQLAREMDLTATSIGRYIEQLNTGGLPDVTWVAMVQALRLCGVEEAERIRPLPPPKAVRTDLVPLLDKFETREHITALIKILDGHRDAQAILRVVAEERLKHLP